MLLQALKERLVERANIIQARHDAETAALLKRQVRAFSLLSSAQNQQTLQYLS